MNKFFELATKISSAWSLAAFAITALVLLVTKLKGRKIPAVIWWVVTAIVIIALAPTVAPLYLNSYGIYRVHVVVLDESHIPVNEANVTCTGDGVIKKADRAWECAIPAKTKSADGKIQAFATVPDAFLTGHADLELKDDYSPLVTIQLKQDTSAQVLGMVTDESNQPVEAVHVGVVGYDTEAVLTKSSGGFSLPAHKANGQQVQIFAFKEGYASEPPEWHQAGDHPVTIILRRQTSSKRKHG